MTFRRETFFIFILSFLTPFFFYQIWTWSSFLLEENISNAQGKITERIIQVIEPKPEPFSILFVGDIMLDRTIRKDGEVYGYDSLFSCLKDEFSKYDEVVGNLEGTVTNFTSVSRDAAYEAPESFRFTFDPEAVHTLVEIGLSIVSIANNHIRDFGEQGIEQTILNTNQMNLLTFGDPRSSVEKRYAIKDIKGTKIAFIPYNHFFGTKEQTIKDLEVTRNISDLQIVFAHWGDEYVKANINQKNTAHEFVDNGADLVIGAHPHVIQESEVYKEVPIYYSLGNFIFDQYWEEAVRNGLGVVVTFENKKIHSIKEIYFESTRHAGTCLKTKAPTP